MPMFINEKKTKNKKTGKIYIKHQLLESVRVNGRPSHRVVMGLGKLELHRREWKKLAHALECQLSGQLSLLEPEDSHIEELAISLVSSCKLSVKLSEVLPENSNAEHHPTIDMRTLSFEKSRTLGAEIVCHHIWNLLGFDKILMGVGLSSRQAGIAKALIFGRLISPGSERHTIEWFRNRSALSELPGSDPNNPGKDLFYEVGDILFSYKEEIEKALFRQQCILFPPGISTVLLYDLTNTYMEGSAFGNELAKRGKCKSNRTDCPLITLSLILDNNGTPVGSHIYRGNIGEPTTMEDMLNRLDKLYGFDSLQLPLAKPTLVMDRGIATYDNIELIRSRGYQYIVISREDKSGDYAEDFNTLDDFEIITGDDLSHKYTSYGEINRICVKKIVDDSNTIKVLCKSDGKASKEIAIASRYDKHYVSDVEKLSKMVKKGQIKNIEKIESRLAKYNEKFKITAQKFDVSLVLDDAGKALELSIVRKNIEPNPLAGCYVIESSHKNLDAVETWKLYMTLTKIEASFRSMKGSLGMRPIHHQNSERASAHLFITVLAFHILSVIERNMAKSDDFRSWETLRDVLSTHTRCTLIMKDTDGNIHHTRVSGNPEASHYDVYKKLKVKDPAKIISLRFR